MLEPEKDGLVQGVRGQGGRKGPPEWQWLGAGCWSWSMGVGEGTSAVMDDALHPGETDTVIRYKGACESQVSQ